MRLEGWPQATAAQAAILRDARKCALLRMRSARVDLELIGFIAGRAHRSTKACRTAKVEASLVGSVIKMSRKKSGMTALTLPAHADGTSGPLRIFGDRGGMPGAS